jgi:hypothetical protein
MTCLIITIISAGIFGGTVNFFQLYSKNNKGWINFWKCVIIGLGASFLVPLFLQMISSNLVESSKTNDKDLLVFLGFCLIAAIFSRRFIETIGERILKQVAEAKQTAESAKEIAETSKEEVELLTSKSTEVDESETISPDNETTTTTTTSSTTTTTTEAPNSNREYRISQDDAIKVLKALKDPLYTFRTLKGVTKDSNLDDETVVRIIKSMIRRDWVREIRKDSKILYALSEIGNKIKVLKED